jgi:tRNA(Arg) A34 adenosine deaminase TadA
MTPTSTPSRVSDVDASKWSQVWHERNMKMAITAARHSKALGGAAIGAVIVDSSGALVGSGHSLVGPRCDPLAHAETAAIEAAVKRVGRFHLPDLVLYCTLEPCSMCLGACAWAGLGGVVFGADGTVAPMAYYDRVDYRAVEHARKARRDGDRAPLFVRGRVLFEQASALLGACETNQNCRIEDL